MERLATKVIDNIKCMEPLEPPTVSPEGIFLNIVSKLDDPNFSSVHEFFQTRIVEFQKVLATLVGTQDAALQSIARTLSVGVKKPISISSVKDALSLGDAFLAVECPMEADLLNNNTRHYDVLCAALGKKSVGYLPKDPGAKRKS